MGEEPQEGRVTCHVLQATSQESVEGEENDSGGVEMVWNVGSESKQRNSPRFLISKTPMYRFPECG